MSKHYYNHKVKCPTTGNMITQFEYKWGKHISYFVEFEKCTPEAIRMRVLKNGNPWQRKPEPTPAEKKYQRTLKELALELDIHPGSVMQRISRTGSPWEESKATYNPETGESKIGWNRGKRFVNWQVTTQFGSLKPWVMESAPGYQLWKTGQMTWEEYSEYLTNCKKEIPQDA